VLDVVGHHRVEGGDLLDGGDGLPVEPLVGGGGSFGFEVEPVQLGDLPVVEGHRPFGAVLAPTHLVGGGLAICPNEVAEAGHKADPSGRVWMGTDLPIHTRCVSAGQPWGE
jgi:hypothetical protein